MRDMEGDRTTGPHVRANMSGLKNKTPEPVGIWLPPHMIPAGTSRYAQGVEVPADYSGQVPDGFSWADLDAPRFQMEHQGYRGYRKSACGAD